MPYAAPPQSPTSARARTAVARPPADVPRHGRHKSEPPVIVSSRQEGNSRPSSRSYLYRHRRSPTIAKSVVDLHSELQRSCNGLGEDGDTTIQATSSSSPDSIEEKNSDDGQKDNVSDRKNDNVLAELGSAVITISEEKPCRQATAKPRGRETPEVEDLTWRLDQALRSERHKDGRHRLSGSSLTSILGEPLEVAVQTPGQSDTEDETCSRRMSPMIHKKSGELVRPAIRKRPSSMSGAPSLVKAVHFDPHKEIRHFGEVDRPAALSVGSSPVENLDGNPEFPFRLDDPLARRKDFLWEAEIVNFPSDPRSREPTSVRLNRVFVSSDNGYLVGVIAVANLAYHKHVAARFTLDYWKTVSEVSAEYAADMQKQEQPKHGEDTFIFNIDLAGSSNLDEKRMFICIRYNVNGLEFWDNNNFTNYHVKFTWKRKSKHNESGSHVWPGEPAAKSALETVRPSCSPRSLSVPSLSADLIQSSNPAAKTGPAQDCFSSTQGFSLSPTADGTVSDSPTRRSANVFGNRYDVGASLYAVMQAKPPSSKALKGLGAVPGSWITEKLSDETKSETDGFTGSFSERGREAPRYGPQPLSDLVPERIHHQSAGYKELVDKYCFYGSPHRRVRTKNDATQQKNEVGQDTVSIVQESREHSPPSSDSSLPSSRNSSPEQEEVPKLDPLEPRTASSKGRDIDRTRSLSPQMISYSHIPPIRPAFLSGSPRATAILG